MSGCILSTNGFPVGVWAPQPKIFSHELLKIGPPTPRLIERARGLFVHSTMMPQELCAQKFFLCSALAHVQCVDGAAAPSFMVSVRIAWFER